MSFENTYSPLSFDDQFKVSLDSDNLTVTTKSDLVLRAKFAQGKLHILEHNSAGKLYQLLLVGLEHLFGSDHGLLNVELPDEIKEYPFNHLGKIVRRSEFFQIPLLWSLTKNETLRPERWTETKNVSHPTRARLPEGIFYKKFIPQIGKNLTLRLITENDLDTFHDWHNQPRVSHFWELNHGKAELLDYIRKSLQDPHQFPVIVELDGEEVAYYEFYWVKEDRLGPYYDSEAYDRGFHFLIGNKNFLGFKNTDALIKTVLHALFLDDPRTRKIMAEPRHDNQKVLKYAEASIGWKKLKEFDFPHKRAALLECRRELFFGGNAL